MMQVTAKGKIRSSGFYEREHTKTTLHPHNFNRMLSQDLRGGEGGKGQRVKVAYQSLRPL